MLSPNRILASPVRIDLPGDHDCVAIARMFSGAAARHFELSHERVEDVKIAISEAATSAIDPSSDRRVSVTIEADEQHMRFTVSTDKSDRLESNAIALAVIASLFEDATINQSGETSSVTFSTPRASIQ